MSTAKKSPGRKPTEKLSGKGMNQIQLAELAGKTTRQLFNINRDLPEVDKIFIETEDGGYDPVIFVQRWVKYNVSTALEGLRSLDQVKAAHEIVKKRKTELEVEKMEGDLIDVQDVRRLWGDIANAILQGMLRIPAQLAPQILGIDSQEKIADILDREIRKVLEGISETPLPRYMLLKQEEAEEGEETEEGEDDG